MLGTRHTSKHIAPDLDLEKVKVRGLKIITGKSFSKELFEIDLKGCVGVQQVKTKWKGRGNHKGQAQQYETG